MPGARCCASWRRGSDGSLLRCQLLQVGLCPSHATQATIPLLPLLLLPLLPVILLILLLLGCHCSCQG